MVEKCIFLLVTFADIGIAGGVIFEEMRTFLSCEKANCMAKGLEGL